MIRTIYISIFMILFTLCACVQAVPITPSPTPSSGIENHGTEGTSCPGAVSLDDTQCLDQPYQTAISIIDINNKTITPSPTPSSGIEGHVTKGPMCPGPIAIGDTQCQDQPYQATISIMDANNKLISQFQTDPSGFFKIPLAPGTYILHPKSEKVFPRTADQIVVVTAYQFTQLTIMYDTGMR